MLRGRDGGTAKKLARSLLFYAPVLYDLVHSQARSELQYRLRRPHDADFRSLSIVAPGRSPLVLDIGANIGQSVYSIKAVSPEARVVSFEVNPVNGDRLRRLERRFSSVRVEAVGLAAEPGSAILYVPSYHGKPLTALAALDEAQARGWLGPHNVLWFRPEWVAITPVEVRLTTLDAFELQPDFIKIDVEGGEDAVIGGGLDTIRRSRPVIMAERLLDGPNTRILRDNLGYHIAEFDGERFRPFAGGVNSFLVPFDPVAGSPR